MLNWLNSATQIRRNLNLSHVRTSTQISDPRSSNSMLRCPCAFAQPNMREKMRGTSHSEWSTKTQQQKASGHAYVDTGNRKFQPTPHPETMLRLCSLYWQLKWIATTVDEPTRKTHPVATLQPAMTPSQGLVTWHPDLQNHPQSDSQQKDTPDRE